MFTGLYVGFTCGVLTSNHFLMGIFFKSWEMTGYPLHNNLPTPQQPTHSTTAYPAYNSIPTPRQPAHSTTAYHNILQRHTHSTTTYHNILQRHTHSTTTYPLNDTLPTPQQHTHSATAYRATPQQPPYSTTAYPFHHPAHPALYEWGRVRW